LDGFFNPKRNNCAKTKEGWIFFVSPCRCEILALLGVLVQSLRSKQLYSDRKVRIERGFMNLTRREFIGSSAAALTGFSAAAKDRAQMDAEKKNLPRIIYYNNFASHLLCSYNPNMYYPHLPLRWSDQDWCRLIDMIADFGFNVFEFWLEPRLFCREGFDSEVGREFVRQMNVVVHYAHTQRMKCELIAGLATVGVRWRTLCPNIAAEWREICYLWDTTAQSFPEMDIFGIFPGDPGACSRNGCTAETYIDKAVAISQRLKKIIPRCEIEFNTWGPPIFGWGNIHMAADSQGEFIPQDQASAWSFSKIRSDRAMNHLLSRLDDFPADTIVAINMGFNPDGNPTNDQDARPWVREIARRRPVQTWDFSLTEGENAVYPHYRFERLFERRKQERAAAPYQGGICFTMTPLLNQLSLFESAQSFQNPDANADQLATEFFTSLFGAVGDQIPGLYRLFECLPDWGSYHPVKMARAAYHRKMADLVEVLAEARKTVNTSRAFHPQPEWYRQELLFYACLFRDLTATSPDYDTLKNNYWQHVYAIYDQLPDHVDPRPRGNTNRFIEHFMNWKE
jgi:hypothetical protein